MTKSILVMALAATLVLSTFTLGNTAFAVEKKDKYKIALEGPASCTDSSDEDCGIAGIKGVMVLEFGAVQHGTSKTYLKGKANITINVEDNRLKLKGDPGKNTFQYNGEEIRMSGPLKASKGSIWDFEMRITNIDLESESGDCSSTLTSSGGTTIEQPSTQCGIIFVPIGGR